MKRTVFIPLLLLGTSVLAADDSWIQQAYHKSFHYEQTENYKAAIKSLLPVVRAYPKGYTANLRLGWLYYLMARYANSIAHYEVAIKTAPNAIEAKIGKLLPLLAQERYSEAEQTTYQILNTDFYNYLGNLRLSIALRKQKKTDLALEVVNKMLFLYPTNVSFLVELGQLYDQKGEKEKAAAVFRDVLVLAPENVTAKSYLGM
ncbi:hypothetical protein PN36_10595 [Candidatus Thiomargarita nelsonii]|uniref:Uncharacterized protein n=1 Tax=Candidatus Thiomargarita nelsonii TaxID=1003181 RepID=A0A0A6S309_9GAMM|nr:hypothetical protein PN36_10595 [Candidatus Thiomargarita nelsonii]